MILRSKGYVCIKISTATPHIDTYTDTDRHTHKQVDTCSQTDTFTYSHTQREIQRQTDTHVCVHICVYDLIYTNMTLQNFVIVIKKIN